jgi:hypothetical protein
MLIIMLRTFLRIREIVQLTHQFKENKKHLLIIQLPSYLKKSKLIFVELLPFTYR